ncbi:MAG TPA: hypothetical protein VJ770_07835 [Stellaceae bacterium]|nr:hypothetical protein [Stellaceae bacterium]
MTADDLDRPCGRHFTFRQLIEVGETWRRVRVPNLPERRETVAALRRLAEEILDPVADSFGLMEITYGFASWQLTRYVPGRIDPTRDQHAGYELRLDGRPICPRLGQAADFCIPGVCSGVLCVSIAASLPFDRLYFYGRDRPIHVSVGPDESRAIIVMLEGPSGRRVPQKKSARWLAEHFG